MASSLARKFWDTGVWLSEAWIAFADEASRIKLEGSPDFLTGLNQFAANQETTSVGGLFKAFSAGAEASRQRRELADAMKENLLDALFNSQLVATGFREFPSPSSNVVRIDADHFDDGSLDWDKSKLSADGRKWGRIKISSPSICIEQTPKGSRAAIRQAIRELSFGGLNFNSITRKVGAQAIRDKLSLKEERGNGLSDVNLAKLIVEECGKRGIYN